MAQDRTKPKILSSEETDKRGLSGKTGQVYGETTPSVTGAEVIGGVEEDFAINVNIEDIDEQYWFAPHLLEFIDHAEGTTLQVGNIKAVRQSDGSWEETKIIPDKKWWQFWNQLFNLNFFHWTANDGLLFFKPNNHLTSLLHWPYVFCGP